MNQFINKHPWMTFFIGMTGLSLITVVATARSINAQLKAATPPTTPPSN